MLNRIFSSLIILLICFSTFSQNISLEDLQNLTYKKNWTEINSVLINKDWKFYSSNKESESTANDITWAYRLDDYSETAMGWITYYYDNFFTNSFSYQFYDKSTYIKFNNHISKSKLKEIESNLEKDRMVVKYEDDNFTITVTISRGDITHTAYTVDVQKKFDWSELANGYKKIFYDNGNVKVEYTLKEGELNGLRKEFYENGNLKTYANFKDGILFGDFFRYSEDGEMELKKFYYENGTKYILTIYENEKKSMVGEFVNEKGNGLFRFYDSEGRITAEKYYKDNLLQGEEIRYWFYVNDKSVKKRVTNYIDSIKNGSEVTTNIINGKSNVIASFNFLDGLEEGECFFLNDNTITYVNYLKGEYNGEYKVYEIQIPYETDTSKCKLLLTQNYLKGELNGESIEYDFENNSIAISNFKLGVLTGEHRQYNIIASNQLDTTECMLKIKGSYLNNKKNGCWIDYSESGSPIRLVNYSNDVFNGDCLTFYDYPNIKKKETYANGIITDISVFSSINQSVTSSFHKQRYFNNMGMLYDVKVTYENGEISTLQEYELNKTFLHPQLLEKFIFSNINDINYPDIYRDGQYALFNDSKPEVIGEYFKDSQVGEWKYIFYEQNCVYNKILENDYEFFSKIEKDEEPFSGELNVYKNKNLQLLNFENHHLEVISIVNGRREGKTKFYNNINELIKVDKYKIGVLKNSKEK